MTLWLSMIIFKSLINDFIRIFKLSILSHKESHSYQLVLKSIQKQQKAKTNKQTAKCKQQMTFRFSIPQRRFCKEYGILWYSYMRAFCFLFLLFCTQLLLLVLYFLRLACSFKKNRHRLFTQQNDAIYVPNVVEGLQF